MKTRMRMLMEEGGAEGGGGGVAAPAAAPSPAPDAAPSPVAAPSPPPEPTRAGDVLKGVLEEAKAAAATPPPPPTPTPVKEGAPPAPSESKAPFSFRRGEEVVDAAALGLPDDLQITYTAKGKEQAKSLPELVRMAQQVHGVSETLETLRSERKQLGDLLKEREATQSEMEADRDVFLKMLKDPTGATFKRVQEHFLKAMGGEALEVGEAEAPPANLSPEDLELQKQLPKGMTVEHVRKGQSMVEQQLLPYTQQLAEAFPGADAMELLTVGLELVQDEPQQLLTPERVQEIFTDRLLEMLEAEGYERAGDLPAFSLDVGGGKAPAAANRTPGRLTPKQKRVEVLSSLDERLQQENQRLREQLEAMGVRGQRQVLADAPPPPGGSGAPPAGGALPLLDLSEANSANDVKEALRTLRKKAHRS
jgi:hypothetical protein